MHIHLQAQFQLFGTVKKQDGWYVVHCPPLDITTQGRTEAAAKRNLAEASRSFAISCFERGTFEQALRELGWTLVAGSADASGKSERPALPRGAFPFSVPVPFGLEKAWG